MDDFISSMEIISRNQDLLTQILLRLAAKPLIRFKSASKHWLSLISSPQFCSYHTLQNPNKTISGLFLRKSSQEFQFLSLDDSNSQQTPDFSTSLNFSNDHSGTNILQSCNGLLLGSGISKMGFNRKYYIYNPSSNQFLMLPSVAEETSSIIFCMTLAFDPSKSCRYKVVCIKSMPRSLYYHQIAEYFSEDGAWRICGSPFTVPHDMLFDNGVYWNGAVHWISETGNSMCYDLDRKCFMPMPELPILKGLRKKRIMYFGESGARLFFIEIPGSLVSKFEVFEMENDYSQWEVKYHVDLGQLVDAFPEMLTGYYCAFVVLCVGVGEDGSPSLWLHIPGKVIVYELNEKICKKVFELGVLGIGIGGSLQFGCLNAYPYVESLACI